MDLVYIDVLIRVYIITENFQKKLNYEKIIVSPP